MRRFHFLTVFSAALILLPLLSASAQQDSLPPPLPIGSHAPALHSRTLTGKRFSLQALRGHVVLLDYWATWCGTCRMVTPVLESLHEKFAERGLRVVGISLDDASSVAQIPHFARVMHMTYTLCASPKQNNQAAQRFNATGIPVQFLIDKHGVIRWAKAGFTPDEEPGLSALIHKLLLEKA